LLADKVVELSYIDSTPMVNVTERKKEAFDFFIEEIAWQ